MMNTNKYTLFSLGIIILLFISSIFIRQENLSAPLSRYHEWITAHTLITTQIWEENGGPSTYNFNPVYTYPGAGNNYRNTLGGISKSNGDVYYVSYPPFTYLFAYYGMKLLGGSSIANIRTLSLIIHFTCAIILFFLLGKLRNKSDQKSFNLIGILGAGFYIFGEGNLWNHSNLYFADTLIQPIVLGLGLMLLMIIQTNRVSAFFKIGFSILIFLAIYTEWLGLFFAFILGVIALYKWAISGYKKYKWVTFSILIGTLLSIGLILIQYSGIENFDTLKEVWTTKYTERSGYSNSEQTVKQYNITGEFGLTHLKDELNYNFNRVIRTFSSLTGLLIILLLFRRNRHLLPKPTHFIRAILFTLVIVLLHYLIFFNFNAMHGFSSIKTGVLFILIGMLIYHFVFAIIKGWAKIPKIIAYAVVLIFTLFMYTEAIQKYWKQNTIVSLDYKRVEAAKTISTYESPEIAIFVNANWDPIFVYYAHHNILPIPSNDTTQMRRLIDQFKNENGIYFHHEGSVLVYKQTITNSDNHVVFSKPIYLNH